MLQKLSTQEVENRLNSFDFAVLKKPGRNKGDRGRLLEQALGMTTGADLNDMVDGELKSFTIGESIAVTMLRHCLPDIIDIKTNFSLSKVYTKLRQTIFVGFDREGNYQISKTINETNSPGHFMMLEEDYNFVANSIRLAYIKKIQLGTTTGPNKLLQIRTKDSKRKDGTYNPLHHNGTLLKDKSMAFYLCPRFGRELR